MKNFYEMLQILERMEPTCHKCGAKLEFSKEVEHYEEWKCEECGAKVYMDIGAKAEYDKHFGKKRVV
jgi:DNA-directed RNA polymerase subunit RPC12/RpoP